MALDCEQGALLWENASGSLLATFVVPRQFHGKPTQICFRFPDPLPEGFSLQRLANQRLLPMPLPLATSQSLRCLAVQSPADRVRLFLRAGQPSDSAAAATTEAIGLYYAVEHVQPQAEGENAPVQCGLCSRAQFLDAFCSANFVFIGKLLQLSPEANSLEFSAESPLLRRPLLLAHITRPGAQFNSTTLFTQNCPAQQTQIRPSFHRRFVVVAKAQLGYGRLLCLLDFSEFQQIPAESAPCDILLRRR